MLIFWPNERQVEYANVFSWRLLGLEIERQKIILQYLLYHRKPNGEIVKLYRYNFLSF
jgi:hypothetical protein